MKFRNKTSSRPRSEPLQTIWFVAVAVATAAAALSQIRTPMTRSAVNRPIASDDSTSLEIDPGKTLEIMRGRFDSPNSSMISNSVLMKEMVSPIESTD